MSRILINEYVKQLDIIKRSAAAFDNTVLREAFKDWQKVWDKQQNLTFFAQCT
jgi:hypothetical protein